MKKKSSIPVAFLITLVLAGLLFFPTCKFFADYLRLSTEAKGSFNDFVESVKQSAENLGVSKYDNKILYLDEGTAVVFFQKNSKTAELTVVTQEGISLPYYKHLVINRPTTPECSLLGSCICRCTKFIEDKSYKKQLHQHTYYTCDSLTCEGPFDFDIQIAGLLQYEEAEISVIDKMQGGIIIEKDPIAGWPKQQQRHISTYIQKCSKNTISICLKHPCCT